MSHYFEYVKNLETGLNNTNSVSEMKIVLNMWKSMMFSKGFSWHEIDEGYTYLYNSTTRSAIRCAIESHYIKI